MWLMFSFPPESGRYREALRPNSCNSKVEFSAFPSPVADMLEAGPTMLRFFPSAALRRHFNFCETLLRRQNRRFPHQAGTGALPSPGCPQLTVATVAGGVRSAAPGLVGGGGRDQLSFVWFGSLRGVGHIPRQISGKRRGCVRHVALSRHHRPPAGAASSAFARVRPR